MRKRNDIPETILQQILDLPFKVGEVIATLFVLIPAFVFAMIRTYVFRTEGEVGTLFIIFCGVFTIIWLLFLEKVGKVTITTPVLPIPLKWVIPIVLIIGLFGGFD